MSQVVIDDIIPRTQLIASSGQLVFNTNWTANATTDVVVYAREAGIEADDETQEVSTTDYVVTFVGSSQTVRVTFNSGRTAGDIITIVRNTPAERLNLYVNTNFTPSMLNEDFGILTLVDQQAQMYDTAVTPRYNLSAIIEPATSLESGDLILPILGPNQVWAKNSDGDAIVAYDVPESGGLAPSEAKYLVQTADLGLPNAQAMGQLASGLVVNTTSTGVQLTRTLAGTASEIDVTNGDGISGNPTIRIAANLIVPGTEGIGIPQGTTAQRPVSPSGTELRYNTDLLNLEYWDGSSWVQLSDTLGVLSAEGTENQVLVNGTFGTPEDGLLVLSLPQDIGSTSSPTFAGLTLNGPLSPDSGGTGVNNGSSTLTLAGSLSTVGAYTSSFTMTGNTSVTFPTSGTLLTSATAVSSLAATANQTTVSGATGDVVVGLASNAIMPGTGGLTLPQGNNAARAGSAGTIRFNTQSAVFESTVDGTNWAVIDTSASGDVDSIIGTTNQVIASNPTGNVTLSLPQDIATTSDVQFNSARLSNAGIKDANNNTIIGLNANASAVNYLEAYNAATGFPPQIVSAGSDTDIAMYLVAKGDKPVTLFGGYGGTFPFCILSGTGYQHVTNFNFSNTAASRTITVPDATGTMLLDTTLNPPTVQQFLSGSGTYTTPTNPAPLYIRVIAVGGGGGGQGGAGAGQGAGTSGGNTTFGGTLIVANGGANGAGSGGTVSIAAGAVGIGISGGRGGSAVQLVNSSGGNGAPGAFGGAGNGGSAANPGNAGATGSGSGGGGGGASGSAASGSGGSAGAYADAIITSPAATYAYAVGAAGSGGAAGAGAGAGANGGSGRITVYEFYQ